MLIEFRVENYRSLRTEQVLTLEADGPTEGDDRVRHVEGYGKPLLPLVALYGANASGKSNVLSALAWMRQAVLDSHRLWRPDSGVPVDPFAWGKSKNDSSLFEVTLLLGGVRYQYGFVADKTSFVEEWLFAWPNGRKQVWFERDAKNKFTFGDHLRGENRVIEALTRPNSLFLSAAVQNNHELLQRVYQWYDEIVPFNVENKAQNHAVSTQLRTMWDAVAGGILKQDGDVKMKATFLRFLKFADLGILDCRAEVINLTEKNAIPEYRFYLKHEATSKDAWLPLQEESLGTQSLFRLTTPLFLTWSRNGVLLVDELEASLHPHVASAIARTFKYPVVESENSNIPQLIFTTHDTQLLGNTVGPSPLRRDQVWLTEKDKHGATTLYPLTDYQPRNSENLERGYLQGRYGAIPFLGNFAASVE